jgi:isopenicillin-N epimerase
MASPSELAELRDLYLLRKDIAFLNHGSFGACPRPVFETYQRWQAELERQPVDFFRKLRGRLAEARAALGQYVGTNPDNLVFVQNLTWGMNAIARSLQLKPGDEVLTTNLEYGAVDKTWGYYSGRYGYRYVNQPITVPVTTAEQFVEELWSGVNERTRVLMLSHITSGTALRLPVESVIKRARAAGLITVIDGAHAVSQVDLNLDELGVDFYVGNCHKWLSAPKGSAFLFARPERQDLLEPLIISHGYLADHTDSSPFLDHYQGVGTMDPAAYLSVPAAIEFQREHDWTSVRAACHELVRNAREQVGALSGLPQIAPDSTDWFVQMATIPLPQLPELTGRGLHDRLWNEFGVEIPATGTGDQPRVRISIQAYNNQADVDRLVNALKVILTETGKA